jgi:hypothetical protein
LNKIQYNDHDDISKRDKTKLTAVMAPIEAAVHRTKIVSVLNDYVVVALHVFTSWMLPFSIVWHKALFNINEVFHFFISEIQR